ncbi:ABC transporter substrate-binding protein [Celeribacter indicus]|uniref:Aliphatic sulfonates family ABC transporter periplasmic ligand-binding protein n=1 Tax=Celeribacter indicus TaxID=1208324 RepID=A0A0B5E6W1_9RHOB|nr:ABC transporter substrate-binding protein [Celeribacter indicus]AJE48751.1 aliphatic sulfonates family ABC transporter periplasmic ligand-binding protein [Celeribacter indicus]SDX11457.1 sulfonate transport system substrate-binding protein [Celeribacter indicus]
MTAPVPLRIGVHPGSQALFLAWHLGTADAALAASGARAEWLEFSRGLDLPGLLASRRIEVGGSGALPLLLALADGVELVLLGATAPRPAFAGILVRKGDPARDLTDLIGRSIGVTLGSWQEMFLALAAEHVGGTLADFTLVEGFSGREALLAGRTDAWFASGAALVAAERDPAVRLLPDLTPELATRGLWRGNRSYWFADRSALRDKRGAIAALLEALRATGAAVQADPERTSAIFAAHHPRGDKARDWAEALSRLPWEVLPAIVPGIAEELQAGADALLRAGRLSGPVTIAAALADPQTFETVLQPQRIPRKL